MKTSAIPLLLVTATLCACGDVPDREYGPFEGGVAVLDDATDAVGAFTFDAGPTRTDEDSDATIPSNTAFDNANDPSAVAVDTIPLPLVICPDDACMEEGDPDAKPEGVELVRQSFLRVAGRSELGIHADGPTVDPQGGVIGQVRHTLASANELLDHIGYDSCDDLPLQGGVQAGDTTVRFQAGQTFPPKGFAATGRYEHSIEITDDDGSVAVIETTCGERAAHVSLMLVGDEAEYSRVELFFDVTDINATDVEVFAFAPSTNERLAMRFANDEEDYQVSLIRVASSDNPSRSFGIRMLASGDSGHQTASVLLQEVPEQENLYRARGASMRDLQRGEGISVMCADFASPHSTEDEVVCGGLDLAAPIAPSIDANGAYSIGWAARPVTMRGMLASLRD